MVAAASLLVSGLTWSGAGSATYPGRFPLSVERHVMSMVDNLVPAVTTVTLNARYYALHGLVAAEARRSGLSELEAVDLMRRAEVVIGAVSARHLRLDEDAHRALRRPHGMELIAPKVDGGIVIGALAAPKAYAQLKWGFSAAYRASEAVLQIIKPRGFEPGELPAVAACRSDEGASCVRFLATSIRLGVRAASELLAPYDWNYKSVRKGLHRPRDSRALSR